MTTNETSSAVTAFFESYRLAFQRLDASAIAEHFAYPSHITSDTGEIVLIPAASKLEWTRQIERLLAMYRVIGFASARILERKTTELSPRIVQASVDWELQDGRGSRLYTFQALYTLVRIGDAFRIGGLAHNEIPRYRECLARLQSLGVVGSPEKGGDR